MKRLSICFAIVSLVQMLHHTALAGNEVVASQSVTVQPNGPRSGDTGKKYLNIEGRENDKYASFGVLVFDVPKDVQDKKVTALTLSLVQTSPRFAKEGSIKLLLAPDFDSKAELKFDPAVPDGVGKQIAPLHELGTGDFKNPEQGKPQTFRLTVSDTVRERVARGGRLCLVIVPADAKVAATYYGADEQSKDNSPKLTFELP